MAVAKSYANLKIDGDPFKENGRLYVNVITTKGLKKVRWYSDAEYARMYPDAPISTDIMMTFNARHAFGFEEKGYITLYRGEQEAVETWAHKSWPPVAWHNLTFGFYTPSNIDAGAIPNGIEPVKLTWDEVKQDDIHMKSHEEVKKYVDILLGNITTQTAEWKAGDWIEKKVTIKKKETKDSRYGDKHTYTMLDAANHSYVWETGARDYSLDVEVTLKMKVKEIKDNAIVVWYCKEI